MSEFGDSTTMNSEENSPSDQADESFERGDNEQPVPPADVVAYNELRSCADLVRMFTTGKLEIQPDFQREVVWERESQARFIDSLVKQLPIPSMCFSLDYKSQKWKVIDGLQRMSSIIHFLGEKEWKIASQPDIDPRLRDVTNVQLREGNEEQRRIYSQVEEVSIPITVIRCDYSSRSHMRYLFTIFYRLNSAGVRLTNQEIRNCIYSGAFNDMLKLLDRTDEAWARVRRRVWGKMDRFRSVEVLLRTVAFASNIESYDGNLAGFLNNCMHARSRDSLVQNNETAELLKKAIASTEVALKYVGSGKKSLTLVEALLVGFVGRSSELGEAEIANRVGTLLRDPVFADASKYAIASEQNVKARLRTAAEILRE